MSLDLLVFDLVLLPLVPENDSHAFTVQPAFAVHKAWLKAVPKLRFTFLSPPSCQQLSRLPEQLNQMLSF